jgi:hypothetical protein
LPERRPRCYPRERRGRSLIKTRMPIASRIQGEKTKCRTVLKTISARIAMKAMAMMKSIGGRSPFGWG